MSAVKLLRVLVLISSGALVLNTCCGTTGYCGVNLIPNLGIPNIGDLLGFDFVCDIWGAVPASLQTTLCGLPVVGDALDTLSGLLPCDLCP